ncbi:hypothetical protein QR680_000481 [Steinernema hermaphroditum]|uniref:Piwi domain-containing protein n=1 Tax=Steinernema hermaphroditum TaxID=289476 RepID=A0AA39GVL8_9BILA|nr:hypothetical protein QR680_000481 [Steinernema hermaphroditum]
MSRLKKKKDGSKEKVVKSIKKKNDKVRRKSKSKLRSSPREEVETAPVETVFTNAVELDLSTAPTIYEYEFVFVYYRIAGEKKEMYKSLPVETNVKSFKPFELALGLYGSGHRDSCLVGFDLSAERADRCPADYRLQMTFDMFEASLQRFPKYFGNHISHYVYDGEVTVYTKAELKMYDGRQKLVFKLDQLPYSVKAYLGLDSEAKNIHSFAAYLKPRGTVDLTKLGTEALPNHRVLHFLGSLIWQNAMLTKGQKVKKEHGEKLHSRFIVNSMEPVQGCFYLKVAAGCAVKVSYIPTEDRSDERIRPIVRLVPQIKPRFHLTASISVEQFAYQFLRCGTASGLTEKLRYPENVKKLSQILEGLYVKLNLRNRAHNMFKIDHVSFKRPADIAVSVQDKRLTLEEFMLTKYGHSVKRDLPCVARKMIDGTFRFYPMNGLWLLADQPISSDSLTVDTRSSLEKILTQDVNRVLQLCNRSLADLNLHARSHSRNIHLMAFGVFMKSGNFVHVPHDKQPHPVVAFRHTRHFPNGNAGWPLHRDHFVCAADTIPTIAFVNTTVGGSSVSELIGPFKDRLFRELEKVGIDGELPRGPWFLDAGERFGKGKKIVDMLNAVEQLIRRSKATYFVVIANDELGDRTRAVWKLAESTHELAKRRYLAVQFLTQDVMKKWLNQQDQLVTVPFMMDMNLKLGATNHLLQEHNSISDCRANQMSSYYVRSNRMYVGISFTQPSTNISSTEPSFFPETASICFNTNNERFLLRGTCWYQKTGSVDRSKLSEAFYKALDTYSNGLPVEVIVYWKTNSLSKSFELEKQAIRDAIERYVQERKSKYSPKLIFVKVKTQTKTRLFVALPSMNILRNVPSGTTIYEKNLRNEFTIVSGDTSGNLVTPTRYVAEVDGDVILEKGNIERTTHSLCFLGNQSPIALQLPAPLHSAIELSDLGMRNYELLEEAMCDNMDNEVLESSAQRAKDRTEEDWRQYYERMGERIYMPIRDYKYWI